MMSDSMMNEASTLWKMLDDMAVNDPNGYKKFVDKQMKTCKSNFKPPCVRFVIRATLKEDKKLIWIYFCGWSVIPEPKSDDAPIMVKCGEKFKCDQGTGVTLAFNPNVFTKHCFPEHQASSGNETRAQLNNQYQLIWLGLHYLGIEKGMPTVESHSIAHSSNPIRPEVISPSRRSLGVDQLYKSLGFMRKLVKSRKSFIVPEIKTLRRPSTDPVDDDDDPDVSVCQTPTLPIQLAPLQGVDGHRPGGCQHLPLRTGSLRMPQSGVSKLIEEIGGTDLNDAEDAGDESIYKVAVGHEAKSMQGPSVINWRAKVTADKSQLSQPNNNIPNRLKLVFELPGIKSGKDCNVDLTANKLRLEVYGVDDFEPLQIDLPCPIIAELAEAAFSTRRQMLTITAPLLRATQAAS